MTLDELKEHCLKTLKQTEKFPTKTFEEHALVLRLIENQTSVIAELEKVLEHIKKIRDLQPSDGDFCNGVKVGNTNDLIIIEAHIAELKGENKKECSTCKSDNSHENCLGCIEYGHWEMKGENNDSKRID